MPKAEPIRSLIKTKCVHALDNNKTYLFLISYLATKCFFLFISLKAKYVATHPKINIKIVEIVSIDIKDVDK
jgi:hypothetical protein